MGMKEKKGSDLKMFDIEYKIYKGEVCYDIKVNRFIQVREINYTEGRIKFVCGGHTEYYDDAKTVILQEILSNDYVKKNLKTIECIDKCKYAVFDDYWKVKER
jgi:hypothetical protein